MNLVPLLLVHKQARCFFLILCSLCTFKLYFEFATNICHFRKVIEIQIEYMFQEWSLSCIYE